MVAAAREVKLSVPLVVRMKGTNEDLGKKILKDSGLPIISADNMGDAAKKVVADAKESARRSQVVKKKAKNKPRRRSAEGQDEPGLQGKRATRAEGCIAKTQTPRSPSATSRGQKNMSILIDKNTRVMTQGITGKTGMFHTQTSRAYANGKDVLRRRREPEEGRREFRGHSDFRHGQGSEGDRPAPTSR